MTDLATGRRGNEWALRLVEFNLHLARYTHRSWYEHTVPPALLESVLLDRKGNIAASVEPQVSDWLLRQLGLQDSCDWDMSEPQKRLWLLDAAALDRLTQLLSLAMHRQWLLQVIDGTRLRSLRAAVGQEGLRFALDELPPESFHHDAPIVSFDSDAVTLNDSLREDGARTLFSLLGATWRAVRERAGLRFHKTATHGEVPPLAEERCALALELICGRLIPRRLPEWAWLF